MPLRLLPSIAPKSTLVAEPDEVVRRSALVPHAARVVIVELVLLLGKLGRQVGSWCGGRAHLAGGEPARVRGSEPQALPVARTGGLEVRGVLDPVVAAEAVG